MTRDASSSALTRWVERLALVWAAVAVPLGAVALADLFLVEPDLNDVLLIGQDFPAAGVCLAGLFLLLFAARWPALGHWTPPRLDGRRGWIAAGGLALLVGGLCYAATAHYQPMTNDETMAMFDAAIFRSGRLVADVPPEWRPYVPGMAWQFRMETPGHVFWASIYLPVAAAFRALFGLLGDGDLTSPFWMAVSVLAVFGVARRLWPQRLDAALLAAGLLAGSAQAVVNGITAFSMSAHLALNLVWLWLFLRGDRRGDAGALAVGFLATGLHQFVFHPVFAAPFLLTLWLQRRWGRALAYTAAYGAMVGFWIAWWALVLPGAPTDQGHALGPARWLWAAGDLLRRFDFDNTPLMLGNLLRFSLWQGLLLMPLALLAVPSLRRDPVMRALALGFVLMALVVFVLLPNQGFGWGYRYLHGFIGSLCLLAAQAWVTASERFDPAERRAAAAVLAVSVAFSLLVLVPLRLWQAWQVTAPYARAGALMRSAAEEVVVIDHSGIKAPGIAVLNDPLLRDRPKILIIEDHTSADDLRRLCETRSVAVFNRRSAESVGMKLYPPRPKPTHAAKQAVLRGPACRARVLAAPAATPPSSIRG